MTPTSGTDGTWSVNDGTLISYITVKAANSFALYELAPPSSTGDYTTLGILNNGGEQPDLSHLTFWTSEVPNEVPEPSTVALMLLGSVGMIALKKKKN